jgi:hypothetical protein
MSSQAYTPGLKRKELYLVKKTRRLPVPGEVLVKKGDTVSHDTVVARTKVPGEPRIINIAYTLGVEPEEIERYMVIKIGDPVSENQPIALSKSFFGLVKKVCCSPFAGTLEHVSSTTGQAIVREHPITVEVNAYIPGTVVEELPREGVVIQTPAAFIQGIFGIGGETNGELMMVSKKPEEIIEAEHINSNSEGKVIVGGSLITLDALRKAVEIGVRGVVVGGINDRHLMTFLGYELGVAITGHEECGLTLIITEGFGKMPMQEKTFRMLEKFEGKMACINGATQIRAGVMRPEIIIPRKDISLSRLAKIEEESYFSEGLMRGTLVRLIREPHFGSIAKVVSLPVKLQKLETESMARVLEVELEDGRKVIVPRANVEIIEE